MSGKKLDAAIKKAQENALQITNFNALQNDILDSVRAELVTHGFPVDKIYDVTGDFDLSPLTKTFRFRGGAWIHESYTSFMNLLESSATGTVRRSSSDYKDSGDTREFFANTVQDIISSLNKALSPENQIDLSQYLGKGM